MSKIIYKDENNFNFELKDGRSVDMGNGNLSIGNVDYEADEDGQDVVYPMARELANLLHQYARADAIEAAPQDAPGSAEAE